MSGRYCSLFDKQQVAEHFHVRRTADNVGIDDRGGDPRPPFDPLHPYDSTRNHQIVFGRRGTGKTHALKYMLEQKRLRKNIAVYVDLRTIGSSGGLYGDTAIPLPERGTRLLFDVLADFHRHILQICLDGHLDLARFAPVLDSLAAASTQVVIAELSFSEHGESRYRVHFGGVSQALGDLVQLLGSVCAGSDFPVMATCIEDGVMWLGSGRT